MAYGKIKADTFVYDNSGSDVELALNTIPGTAVANTFTADLTVTAATILRNVTLNAQSDLRLADSDSSNYVGFQAPATVASNVVWTLPGTDGSSGQQLTTDGSGTLSWSAAVNVAAASLTGTTMAANVVTSSLTSVGTLTGLTVDGDVTFTGASSNGLWDKSANAFVANLTGDVTGDLTGTADVATAVTVADESSDTSCNVLFTTAATGNLPPKSGTNLTFNSNTGILTATGFAGDITGDVTGNASGSSGSCTGNAATATAATNVTVADESSDTTCFPLFTTAATGDLPPKSGTNLTFNSSTGELEADILKDSKGDVRDIPVNSNSGAYTLVAADAGKVVANSTGGWTVPASVFSGGKTVTLMNESGSAQNITASALTSLYNTADGANIKASTIALGARGMATIWFAGSDTGYIQSAALTIS